MILKIQTFSYVELRWGRSGRVERVKENARRDRGQLFQLSIPIHYQGDINLSNLIMTMFSFVRRNWIKLLGICTWCYSNWATTVLDWLQMENIIVHGDERACFLFNSFWAKMEVCDKGIWATLGFSYTESTCKWDHFIVVVVVFSVFAWDSITIGKLWQSQKNPEIKNL